MADALDELQEQIDSLKHENEAFRKALSEIEADKAVLAHKFITTSLNIRALLQPKPDT